MSNPAAGRATGGWPDGMSMPIPALWQLAQLWFNERMSPTWAPRTIEQSQQLLTAAGFIGPFWSMGGDR